MRAPAFLTIFLFFLSLSAKSQLCADIAYGIFFDGNDAADLPYFVRYSTLTGQQTILKSFPGTYISRNGFEKGFVNSNDNTYYLITDESYSSYNMKLLCLDLNTGNVKNTLALGTTYSLEYNATTNKLYAIRNVEHLYTHYFSELISIDPTTLAITSLYTFPPYTYFQGRSTVIDPVSNIFYISTNLQTSVITHDDVLLAYDINAGTLTESKPGGVMEHMVYNCSDGKIYGFAGESEGYYFCNLNLQPITFHNIAPVNNNHVPWGFNGTELINTDKNIFVCYGSDQVHRNYLYQYQYSFDLTTGSFTNQIRLTQGVANGNRHGLRFNVAWAPPSADFSQQNICERKIQFHPTCENNTVTWDFGDPTSGADNFSNDVHPFHTFSAPGSYAVKLSFSCNPGYQLTKTIDVAEKICDPTVTNPTPKLVIPNLITPNNDGMNDVFKVITSTNRPIQLSIYNSWGNLVYSNSNYGNDWNPGHDGIYYYHVILANPEETHEGWLHVMH